MKRQKFSETTMDTQELIPVPREEVMWIIWKLGSTEKLGKIAYPFTVWLHWTALRFHSLWNRKQIVLHPPPSGRRWRVKRAIKGVTVLDITIKENWERFESSWWKYGRAGKQLRCFSLPERATKLMDVAMRRLKQSEETRGSFYIGYRKRLPDPCKIWLHLDREVYDWYGVEKKLWMGMCLASDKRVWIELEDEYRKIEVDMYTKQPIVSWEYKEFYEI